MRTPTKLYYPYLQPTGFWIITKVPPLDTHNQPTFETYWETYQWLLGTIAGPQKIGHLGFPEIQDWSGKHPRHWWALVQLPDTARIKQIALDQIAEDSNLQIEILRLLWITATRLENGDPLPIVLAAIDPVAAAIALVQAQLSPQSPLKQ